MIDPLLLSHRANSPPDAAIMLPNPPLQVPYKPHDPHNPYGGLTYMQQPLTGHYQPHPPSQSHFARPSPAERPLLQHIQQRRTQSFGAPAQHTLQETVHLRRKTPQGIESTTYEAAPYGTATRPTKHILLPAPNTLGNNGVMVGHSTPPAHWAKDPGVGIQFGPVSYGQPSQHAPQPPLSRLDTSRGGLMWGPSPLGQHRSNSVGDLSLQRLQLMSPQHATPPQSQLNTPTGLTNSLGLLAQGDQSVFLNYHTPQQAPPPHSAHLPYMDHSSSLRPNLWQQPQYPSSIPINTPESQLRSGVFSPNQPYSNVYSFKSNQSISVTPSYNHSQLQHEIYPGINNVSTAPYSLVSPVTDNEAYNAGFMPGMNTNPVLGRDQVFQWARKVYAQLLESQQRAPKGSAPGANGVIYKSVGTSTHPHSLQRRQSYAGQPTHFAGQPGLSALQRNADIQIQAMKGNATAEARKALGTLQQICEASNWSWVDGMLIAGCLAYGLGELKSAEQWYQRILVQKPDHVEATSNLASVYFCMERQSDAEAHWIKAVRTKPQFLEAIEHLVSLLCGQQRMQEAVKWISYVQEKLRLRRDGLPSPPTSSSSLNTAPGPGGLGSSKASNSGGTSSVESSPASVSDLIGQEFDYKLDSSSAYPGGPNFSQPRLLPERGPPPAVPDYAIQGTDAARFLTLIHAKANMLYGLGDANGAAMAFEDAVLIAVGGNRDGIRGLIRAILETITHSTSGISMGGRGEKAPILLVPAVALQTAQLLFRGTHGELPGLRDVVSNTAKKSAKSTTSNSLLSLAKIFQDGMSSGSGSEKAPSGVRDILALYYLSLSLHPSPSTANNVGILLATIQQVSLLTSEVHEELKINPAIPSVPIGSGINYALAYYYYGLKLDSKHAHLYTNLGSLLKDLEQLPMAISMYQRAVEHDGNFDIALANLANAVKDQGKVDEAIGYYKRAVAANPEFAEAVCGLANALNSVCDWKGRGGVYRPEDPKLDRWHVSEDGHLYERGIEKPGKGWMKRVVDIVEKQLSEGERWGIGIIKDEVFQRIMRDYERAAGPWTNEQRDKAARMVQSWRGQRNEGARFLRLVERITRALTWRWYHDKYTNNTSRPASDYPRPQLPPTLSTPTAPTVLPFHTFTCPLTAKQVRMISQRNGLKISCSTLRASWLPPLVYPPPAPPNPVLNIGYVSSDFNNHPLAHLMQSVFGLHDRSKVNAVLYATTPSDHSIHRQQIEKEAPVFRDVSTWSHDAVIKQILDDNIHILVNLNGFTRGARNEIFAARPAPIQMSFMGFAGTLGAEWCDYLLADETAVPRDMVRPWKRTIRLDEVDESVEGTQEHASEGWVYTENIAFTKFSFFCCDHRQSAPGSSERSTTWEKEQADRWKMRKELFSDLSDDTIIMANFNQLYKIEPTTFRSWLRILHSVENSVLWLLRFPELGEKNLKDLAEMWAGPDVAKRIRFTNVANKKEHIARAKICDLFLDTPECNAHTTAADVLWSGTPMVTLPRYRFKMCSRVAASLIRSAVPQTPAGKAIAERLICSSEEEYEQRAIELGKGLKYDSEGRGRGELTEMRKVVWEARWSNELFDTGRWVKDLERVYERAWGRWVKGVGGDIWLDEEEERRGRV